MAVTMQSFLFCVFYSAYFWSIALLRHEVSMLRNQPLTPLPEYPLPFTREIATPIATSIAWVRHEFWINWCFIRRDMLVSLVPGILFSTAALINYPVSSIGDLLMVLAKDVIYFWLCITTFCIMNQINGIEEDRLNKPERPLVVGVITPAAAKIRWYVAMVLFSSFAYATGTLGWALTWQIGCILYEYFGGANHWYFKTFLGGIGVTSEIGAAWQLAQPEIPAIAWHWIGVIGLYLITLMSVQDFRDMAGDRVLGRKTMPLLWGEARSRQIIATGYFGMPVLVHLMLMAPAGWTPVTIFWDIFLAGFAWTIGGRTLAFRQPKSDRKTYLMFTMLLCLYVMSAIFVLRV
jgi:4-hydroxybenzoate polyprenyltransferase